MNKKLISILLFFAITVMSIVPMYAASEDAENLALGKTVWATDQYSATYAPEKVNDGNTATAWASGGTMLSGLSGQYCHITIDLGKTFNITSFVARSRRDVDQGYNRAGWLIQFSNDANFQTFEEVGRKMDAGVYGSDAEFSFELEPKAYRYVRVAHEKRSNMVISEIEVYGEPYFGDAKTEFSDTEGKVADSANLLEILGVMNAVEKTEFMPDILMSRIDALDTVLKASGYKFDDENSTVEDRLLYAEKNKIISSATDFRPYDFVTVQEYKKMMLCAMGYSTRIEEQGGWPSGVFEVSSNLGWKNASAQAENAYASRGTIANITYYALTSPVYNINSYGNGYLSMHKGDLLLLKVFGLKLYTGIVTSNSSTNLFEYSKKNDAFVEIDHNSYIDENNRLGEHIGKKVFFLINEDNPGVILDGYVSDTDNECIEISMEKITKYSADEVAYMLDDAEEEISLSEDCAFIKNGVAKADITEAEFKKENGTVVFIDNDGDDEADVVYLNAPVIAVCDYCADDGEIVDFRGIDGTSVKATYDTVSYFRNGRKVLAEQMSRNALVYCYVSENQKNVRFECFTNKVKGTVSSISRNYLSIDGSQYEMSEYFANNEKSKITVGTVGVFVFDENMKIVALVDSEDLFSGELYGIILGYNQQGLAPGQLKMFTQDDEIVVLNSAEKLKVDGVSASNIDLKNYIGEMIIFKTNLEDEVVEVHTKHAKIPRIVENDIEVENAWYYGDAIFEGSGEKSNMLFPIDTNSIVFTLPFIGDVLATGTEHESSYDVDTFANSIRRGNNGKLAYYNVDDFLTPQIVVKKTTAFSNTNIGMIDSTEPGVYIFESMGEAYENGEYYNSLEVINAMSGEKSKMLYHKDYNEILMYDRMLVNQASVFVNKTRRILTMDLSENGKATLSDYYMPITSLKKGDIIRGQVMSGQTNKFSGVDRIFTVSDFEKSVSYISYGENAPYANASYMLRCGVLSNILGGRMQMSVSADGKYYTSNYTTAKKVVVFDGDITVANSRELPAYVNSNSKIVILSGGGRDNVIFVYN